MGTWGGKEVQVEETASTQQADSTGTAWRERAREAPT